MVDLKDDFWDLEKLLPAKKRRSPAIPVPVQTVYVEAGEQAPSREDRRLSLHKEQEMAAQTVLEYSPDWNPLIYRVRVIGQPSSFRFNRQFRAGADKYWNMTAPFCPYVPFFSFVPQYTQLDEGQLQYYLYWRSKAREGEYLRCDMGYLTMYYYELLNSPELIEPRAAVDAMARLFVAYAKEQERIIPYFSVWMADYCLAHRVPCPSDVLRPYLPEILACTSFKEFYLGTAGDLSECKVDALLESASEYRYQTGKLATGEHGELVRAHMRGAAAEVIRRLWDKGVADNAYSRVTKKYDAFCGAVVATSERYQLEVEYYPIQHTEELRRVLTASLKYAENRIRIFLSVKSRLSVPPLQEEYKALIDGYFERALPKKTVAAEPPPAYEKLYDAPTEGVSFADATAIEAASWENTALLVPSEEWEEACAVEETAPEAAAEKAEAPKAGDGLSELALFLAAALAGDGEAMRRIARDAGRAADVLVGEINEIFYDSLGDAVLEFDGVAFTVIEDYTEEAREWIEQHKTK